MKKLLPIIMTMLFSFSILAGCSGKTPQPENTPAEAADTQEEQAEDTAEKSGADTEETDTAGEAAKEDGEAVPADGEEAAASADLNVIALKGPTAMGLVKLMSDAEDGADGKSADQNSYTFTIAASPDEVTPKLVQGEADIAAVPANLAAVLYNKTEGRVKVLAVNTLGVLYIVESGDTVKSVEDLRGKTIYASGKGATPEYALNYILSKNGIDPLKDVTIEWKAEHTECVAALSAQENAIAMLPQPFVTTAQLKNDKIRTALNLTEEWNKLSLDETEPTAPSTLITGVVVARSEFLEENPEAVAAFMDSYKASVDYVNQNTGDAAALIEKYDIVPAAVAQKALPYCNITFIEGVELKEKLSGYLAVLMEQNQESVGGALPEDDFYYSR